jgi:hypothetical protein
VFRRVASSFCIQGWSTALVVEVTPLNAHLPALRFKEGQQLGCAIADIFVRQTQGPSGLMPTLSGARGGLIRSGFVLGPQRQPQLRRLSVGILDQLFFAPASGSITVTTLPLRLRSTSPVGHHERVRPKRQPAARRTSRMV